MNDQMLVDARVTGRDHHRLPIQDKADMADKRFIQDLIDDLAIVAAAFWQALQGRACCRRNLVHKRLPLSESLWDTREYNAVKRFKNRKRRSLAAPALMLG